jgi:hypothetical protein
VLVVSADRVAAAFVEDILAEMAPKERRCIQLRRGRTCVAAVGTPVWRRLLIIDGEPSDLSAGVLIELVRIRDPTLPIVLVRHGWKGPAVIHDGVHVHPGPIMSRPIHELLIGLLAGDGRQ